MDVEKIDFNSSDTLTILPNGAAVPPMLDGPRVCIIGHGRHGKDEAAAALHGKGRLRYCGPTSWQALPYIARELDLPESFAWDTRHEKRQFWKDWCDEFRRHDPLRLVRLALRHGNIVAGVRDKVEIEALRDSGLFDEILWVLRPGFPEDPTVTYRPADFATTVICNDGTLQDFRDSVLSWASNRKLI